MSSGDQPSAASRRISGESAAGPSALDIPGPGLLLGGLLLQRVAGLPVAQHRVVRDAGNGVLVRRNRLAEWALAVGAVLPTQEGVVVAHDAHARLVPLERAQVVRDVALLAVVEHTRP